MTKVLHTQIQIKNAMHSTCIDDYNQVKNVLKLSMRNAQIVYYSNQFNLYKNNLAKSWKLFKIFIGTHSKALINIIFTINDKRGTYSKDIANSFNNYFVSIGPLLINDIRCSVNPMVCVKICFIVLSCFA